MRWVWPRDGTDEIVMTYFGDGAASEGDVSEALNWAAVMAAPILFLCQNNHWAISTPDSPRAAPGWRSGPPASDSSPTCRRQRRARGPRRHVAGVDTRPQRARPGLHRGGHLSDGGPQHGRRPAKYRDRAEVDLWRARDPLHRVRLLLEDAGTDPAFFEQLDLEAEDLAVPTREAVPLAARPGHGGVLSGPSTPRRIR